jgi:hypothetical protein
MQNVASEWNYISGKTYADPFNEVEVDIVFTDQQGTQWRVPAFWAGDHEFRVRFAPPHAGVYTFSTQCSDPGNRDLHEQPGVLEAVEYQGRNELLKHGPIRINPGQRYFEHQDGKPFFWMGDTWWFAMCRRLQWPDEFQQLTAARRATGFNLIQMFIGYYPDTYNHDPRGANEAGLPWEEGYTRINPAYFDMTNVRIQWLVKSGLVPFIYGSQGYYYHWMGKAKLKKHWRNLIARYGAYPVIWCLCGETMGPFYTIKDPAERAKHAAQQRDGWTAIGRYVRSIDPYHHPLTSHPYPMVDGREEVSDSSVLDFDLLQCGHAPYDQIPKMLQFVADACARLPRMPVVNGEADYEGLFGRNWEDVQRRLFWGSILAGAAGYTYGADGIMQMNSQEMPFGQSPNGSAWGSALWQEACQFSGAVHICLGKNLLERYAWWNLTPHPDWVDGGNRGESYPQPYSAGIPGELRIIYFPEPIIPWEPPFFIKNLEAGIGYNVFFFNPRNGQEIALENVKLAVGGDWQVPTPPIMQDWVLVMERV